MTEKNDRKFALIVGGLLLLVVTIPYVFAWQASGSEHVFGGFLLNPIDGNSYLAKMEQGRQGGWLFHLPYSAEEGKGAYLFLFYLALGHVARLVDLSNVAIFHIARIVSVILMLVSFYNLLESLRLSRSAKWLAFLIGSFGSGLGWLTLPFGGFTADFWVAEAYPFLSAYANPHFPLGLGILFQLLKPSQSWTFRHSMFMFIGAMILSLLLPFGVVIAAIVLAFTLIWSVLIRRSLQGIGPVVINLLAITAGGAPMAIYSMWVTRSDSLLSNWNSQNITPSPGLIELILSISPALLMAMPILWRDFSSKSISERSRISIWLVAGILFVYLPLGLQRRFLTGIYVPAAILAAVYVDWLISERARKLARIGTIIFVLSLPTNLVILLTGVFGVLTHAPELYLTRDEAAALHWIQENTAQDDLFMTSPEIGLVIPAYTGRKVLYGHPFETANANQNRTQVESFYQRGFTALQEGIPGQIDYVFYGEREAIIGKPAGLDHYPIVYRSETVTIYEMKR